MIVHTLHSAVDVHRGLAFRKLLDLNRSYSGEENDNDRLKENYIFIYWLSLCLRITA